LQFIICAIRENLLYRVAASRSLAKQSPSLRGDCFAAKERRLATTPDLVAAGGHTMENRDEIVYSLNIEDIQTVAVQEIGRELVEGEIDQVRNLVGEYINWYDAILNSIMSPLQ